MATKKSGKGSIANQMYKNQYARERVMGIIDNARMRRNEGQLSEEGERNKRRNIINRTKMQKNPKRYGSHD